MARKADGDVRLDGAVEITGKLGVGIDPASIGASHSGVQAGSSSNDAAAGGVLYVTTTQTGNVGTGEDDLASYSVPANTLSANGQSLWFEASGTYNTANSNNKTVRARFGTSGTNLLITYDVVTNQNTSWTMRGRITRTGAATQKAAVGGSQISSTAHANNISPAAIQTGLNQTLSGAVTLKVTGEATSNNDIVIESFIVGWDDANT